MILLDTHVWVWWAAQDPALGSQHRRLVEENLTDGVGVSVISCWEVAMLVAARRLELTLPVLTWVEQALTLPGIRLIELTPAIAVESTRLPEQFHKDPADRMIVATARSMGCPLLTSDEKILRYSHAAAVGPGTR